ncbi:MAG: radical SAM protein [Desulfobacterales bacterium]|nr:radical SAM protein [Desulfobacterales bacterium]
MPQLILVNPWIHDFAAFDLWSKPLGLLYLASHLRQAGFRIHLIDCLSIRDAGAADRDSGGRRLIRRLYGTGKFPRHKTSRPPPLKHIPRAYSRYGISLQSYVQAIGEVREPAALLVTCMMTYWYPGVQEVIRIFKEIHPGVPVILGGTYARLCPDHALRNAGADHVILKDGMEAVKNVIEVLLGRGIEAEPRSEISEVRPYPAFDLLPGMEYIPILTSIGCPYRCTYCASRFLYPRTEKRDPLDVLQEILFWNRAYGVSDFAFYDDALLTGADSHAAVFLEEIARKNLGIRFHTPNALHVREIRPEIAGLLFRAGFRTIRLGLETSDIFLHHRMGDKVSEGEFERAVENLKSAGFRKKDIGAYILMGMPGQTMESVWETVLFSDRVGAMPYLAEYSPMPHTALWEEAIAASEYDLASEPLYQNNTLLPCWDELRKAKVPELRELVRRIRR